MHINYEYGALLRAIKSQGREYNDPRRIDQNVKRIQLMNADINHDLQDHFPAITSKKLAMKSVVGELLWFLRGNTNIKFLLDRGITIWNKDAYNKYLEVMAYSTMKPMTLPNFIEAVKSESVWCDIPGYKMGDLGPVYGHLWRHWRQFEIYEPGNSTMPRLYTMKDDGIDQISGIIDSMIHMPMATTHIVNAWDPSLREYQILEPCHFCFIIEMQPLTLEERAMEYYRRTGFRENTRGHRYFDLQKIPRYGFTLKWMQRSVDTFLGLPFNIASYALLAHILGRLTNTVPQHIKGVLSNVHLYDNSYEAVDEQLSRAEDEFHPGQISFSREAEGHFEDFRNGIASLNMVVDELKLTDITLPDYESHGPLRVEMLARDKNK